MNKFEEAKKGRKEGRKAMGRIRYDKICIKLREGGEVDNTTGMDGNI